VKALFLCLLLSGCTLVHVGVSSGDDGHSEVHPNGVYVQVDKESSK
jgi:uncharacterized protein YceK